ncbi:hypothetical protein C0991_003071 [Blastosporella zonata]|nr:hypothetical protein C0991_003071 [Blastosporella zonata]
MAATKTECKADTSTHSASSSTLPRPPTTSVIRPQLPPPCKSSNQVNRSQVGELLQKGESSKSKATFVSTAPYTRPPKSLRDDGQVKSAVGGRDSSPKEQDSVYVPSKKRMRSEDGEDISMASKLTRTGRDAALQIHREEKPQKKVSVIPEHCRARSASLQQPRTTAPNPKRPVAERIPTTLCANDIQRAHYLFTIGKLDESDVVKFDKAMTELEKGTFTKQLLRETKLDIIVTKIAEDEEYTRGVSDRARKLWRSLNRMGLL